MIKFTDIKQYRNIVRDVCYIPEGETRAEQPTLSFIGTVKLHGTNAGISYNKKDGIWYQSRKRIITLDKDNAGFAFFAENRKVWFEEVFKAISKDGFTTTIFGEWCGGSIQKGVALNQLSKRFVIFAIKYTNSADESDHYYTIPKISNEALDVYNIYDTRFPSYTVDVDFNHPEYAQEEMVKIVEAVENECPFAKSFGISGVGEGVVFSNFDTSGNRKYIFKVKGEKHSTSKVKTLASVDIEKIKSIDAFVDYAVTDNRLNQAIEQVFAANSEEPSIHKMGEFLKWIMRDIVKEELDVLNGNGLEPKDVGKAISNKARRWFMDYLDNLSFRVGV